MIAPWLQPPNFVGAMAAGAQAGLAQRAQAANEMEAAARLRATYDQMAAMNQRAQMEALLRAEQSAAANALREAQLNSLDAYRQGELTRKNEMLEYQKDSLGLRQSQQEALNEYRNKLTDYRNDALGMREQMMQLQKDREDRIAGNQMSGVDRSRLEDLYRQKAEADKLFMSHTAGTQTIDKDYLPNFESRRAEINRQIGELEAKIKGVPYTPPPTPPAAAPQQGTGFWDGVKQLFSSNPSAYVQPNFVPMGLAAPQQRVRRYNPETGDFE